MKRLLFVNGSPRKLNESRSGQIAEAYLEAARKAVPDIEIDTLNLWDAGLPEFSGDKANAKIAVITGSDLGGLKTHWDEITAIAQRFIQADTYLLTVPMWNGGVPYKLKQYIDIIMQPGLLFGLKPDTGYFGLLKDKPATVIYTSGAYAPGVGPQFGADYHSTYMEWWLRQTGIDSIESIRFQPTLLTAEAEAGAARARAEALVGGAALAKRLAVNV